MNTATPRRPGAEQVQACFDFILGFSTRELLRVDEVCERLGVEKDFIYELIAEGALETHRRQGLGRSNYRITRRSVLRWLAESADYVPADFQTTLFELATKLPVAERRALAAKLMQ